MPTTSRLDASEGGGVQSHFGMMLLFSAFVSLAFAVLLRDTAQEQVRLGAMLFAGFVGSGFLLGWLMYGFPL